MPSPVEKGDPKSSVRPAIGFLYGQANVLGGDVILAAGAARLQGHGAFRSTYAAHCRDMRRV
jgi:hypothetical protein